MRLMAASCAVNKGHCGVCIGAAAAAAVIAAAF